MTTSDSPIILRHDKLRKLAKTMLCNLGIPEEDAETAASVLNASDLAWRRFTWYGTFECLCQRDCAWG